MATVDEIGQEKQRISERLARLDAERAKLADQLNELEIAERVLTRFGGKPEGTERRRRGRPAGTGISAARGQRRARGGQQESGVSLSDATLQAVKAHGDGATANDVLAYEALPRPRAEVAPYTLVGGTTFIDPGSSARLDLDLPPGEYVAVCFLPSPAGEAHVSMGMVHPFSVS